MSKIDLFNRWLMWGIGGFLAFAFLPNTAQAGDVIHACVHNNSGNTRIVESPADCRKPERLVQWNSAGSQGPQGPAGPEGPQGPAGPPTSINLYTVEEMRIVDGELFAGVIVRCEPGDVCTGGGVGILNSDCSAFSSVDPEFFEVKGSGPYEDVNGIPVGWIGHVWVRGQGCVKVEAVCATVEIQSVGVDIAIDMEIAGNDARLTGGADIQNCGETTTGGRLDIDVVIPAPGINAADGLKGYQFNLLYDPSVVLVTTEDQNLLLNQAPGSITFSVSESVPDGDGDFASLLTDLGAPGDPEPVGISEIGSGVVTRLTLTGVGPGSSSLTIQGPILVNAANDPIPLGNISNATVVVDGSCP